VEQRHGMMHAAFALNIRRHQTSITSTMNAGSRVIDRTSAGSFHDEVDEAERHAEANAMRIPTTPV
jgi:hypothetical protein